MRYKRFFAAALTLIVTFCGLGITPAFADYNMPYYIEVDLTNQMITVYNTSDNSVAHQMLCSTGKNNSTPTGTWYLPDKTLDTERGEWFLMKSYNCWVKYATRISGAYFFHSIPFSSKNHNAISTNAAADFGIPASHGCIRLRVDDARYIAQNCLAGTRVRIFKSNQKNEDLRTLLYISSYVQESGMTYQEFMGISKDALGVGSKGEEVGELQLRLHDLGYFGESIDGYYGTGTVTAIKNLQKDLGIAQNGITSAELKEIIFSSNAPVSKGQITITEGSSGPVVKQFQTVLKQLGVYDGDIDGVYDLEVIEAVKELQLLCGYAIDGVATPEIQQLAYYEVNRLTQELGDDFQVKKVAEEVNMATMTFENSKILLRSQPNTRSDELTKLSYGDQVVVLAVQDEWAMVYAGGYTGFMYTKYLTPFTKENYVYEYSADGKTLTIGNTSEQMRTGTGRNEQAEFRNYYTSSQYTDFLNDPVEYVTVNTGSDNVKLNMRDSASSEGKILAKIANGTNLRVLATDDAWTRVGYEENIGYLMNEYLTFWEGTIADLEEEDEDDDAEVVYEDQNITAVVIAERANGLARIYQSPDTNSQIVGSVGNDRQVHVFVVDEESDWVYVGYGDTRGFMQDKYLTFRLGI